ncbi:MAG: hypothetical protein WD737_10170 [Gemmatimonadota bacterium]
MTGRRYLVAALMVASWLLPPTPMTGQEGAAVEAWNNPRTMELVRQAIDRRTTQSVDSTLQTYTADARGYVYFMLDAPQLERQTLVRTDQVAVQVYWRSPDDLRQRIIGLREQKELPVTGLYYYLDRMTLVQDNFDEGIIIADGDNVDNVPHPIAAGAESVYEYRLTDSLTLRLPGVPDPVRVHEVEVRPRDTSLPAVVGSIFLEGGSGALVRMAFTFTPAAYVDPRLDFINVTLENGLWQGRYWLPYEQRLEIRREMPELDLPVGTLIRTRLRVGEYRFNQELPEWIFESFSPITLAPREQREIFPFERPIDAEWRMEGFGEPAAVGDLRQEARTLVRDRMMSGLPRSRLGIEGASDVFRFNRAEGAFVGFGWGFRPGERTTLRLKSGWAFGAEHPVLEAALTTPGTRPFRVGAFLNRRAEVGGTTPAAGLTNTFAALVFGEDWYDPFYTSGGEAAGELPLSPEWSLLLSARLERQRSAALTTTYSLLEPDDPHRRVRPIDEGTHASLAAGVRWDPQTVTGGWWSEVEASAGALRGSQSTFTFARAQIDGGLSWSRSARRASLELRTTAGLSLGTVPRQELYLLGGRADLPGYRHRAFGGDRFALARVVGSADLLHPWLRPRISAAAGWTGVSRRGHPALQEWNAVTTGGIRPAVGIGAGLFYDLFRVDVARGLGVGGLTQLIVEIQPNFWDFL